MNYIYAVLGLVAGFHAFSYGRWLMKNNNMFGGYVVYFIVALCMSLPLYRVMTAH